MEYRNANIVSFAVGGFSCYAINDGLSTYATAAFMFDNAPSAELADG